MTAPKNWLPGALVDRAMARENGLLVVVVCAGRRILLVERRAVDGYRVETAWPQRRRGHVSTVLRAGTFRVVRRAADVGAAGVADVDIPCPQHRQGHRISAAALQWQADEAARVGRVRRVRVGDARTRDNVPIVSP